MKNTRASLIATLILVYLALVMIACTLSSEPQPTLVARVTNTPPPTIGYQTLSPDQLPDSASTAAPSIDARLINLLNQVEPDRLFLHVNTLQGFSSRHVNSPYTINGVGIGAAQNYIRQQFEQIRDQSNGIFFVEEQSFPVEWGGVSSTATNVIGILQGRETGAGIIVIGAHYDSISLAFEDGNAYAPGANDNASGVAALIEMARIMSRRQPRATVLFVAFSAEEIQRVGSINFVNQWVVGANLDVRAMINMDIIGSSTGPDGSINDREIRLFSSDPNESEARQLARAMQVIARRHAPDLAISLQPAIDRDGRYGDHISFSEAGYPAVRFTEMNEDVSRAHNDRDTLDDIQALYLTRSTQTILAVSTALAEGIQPPQSIQLRDDGDGLRTLVWERRPEASGYLIALRAVGSISYNEILTVNDTFVRWDGFVPSRFAGVAIAAIDSNGLVGPFSFEYAIVN